MMGTEGKGGEGWGMAGGWAIEVGGWGGGRLKGTGGEGGGGVGGWAIWEQRGKGGEGWVVGD